MANNKNNMDKFLRESLGDLKVNPSQSVWKGITKRLIILELLRLNFTNVGKAWLYSGLATVATVGGLTYFGLTHQTEEKTQTAEPTQTEQITNNSALDETLEIVNEASEAQETSEAKTTTIVSHTSNDTKETQQKSLTSLTEESKEASKSQKEAASQSGFSSDEENSVVSIFERDELPQAIEGLSISMLNKPSGKHIIPGIGRAQMTPFNSYIDEEEDPKSSKSGLNNINWILGASYNPEWPLSDEDMYVNNHQLALNAGIEFKKWSVNIGVGLRTEKTPSLFSSHYLSYDSVGYFYDIDYYEVNPDQPDSIIIYYTVENLYDSVAHQSDSYGPDQRRRWIFIPVSLGYQLHSTPKYQLYANIFGQFGWQTYLEKSNMDLKLAAGSTMTDITPDANSNYLQIGVGLENNFNIFPHWWIYAEPRINYYINTPYSINQTAGNGPYSFGIKLGIKYKFKRR